MVGIRIALVLLVLYSSFWANVCKVTPSSFINIDDLCSQWHISFTGLYLQVSKYRAIFKITSSKIQIQCTYAAFPFLIQNTLVVKHKHKKFDKTCVAKSDFKNSPVFADL